MDNRPRYRVPDELRETLLDFTIAYLLERPANLVDFGIQFFQRLKGEREGGASGARGSQGSTTLNGRNEDEVEGEVEQLFLVKTPFSSDQVPTRLGPGGYPGPYQLDEVSATWIFHLAARYILERPKDIASWGLQYCLNEKERWAYA